jgi:hypothetical protein
MLLLRLMFLLLYYYLSFVSWRIMDDLMMIKARFDSRGKLATHLQH